MVILLNNRTWVDISSAYCYVECSVLHSLCLLHALFTRVSHYLLKGFIYLVELALEKILARHPQLS